MKSTLASYEKTNNLKQPNNSQKIIKMENIAQKIYVDKETGKIYNAWELSQLKKKFEVMGTLEEYTALRKSLLSETVYTDITLPVPPTAFESKGKFVKKDVVTLLTKYKIKTLFKKKKIPIPDMSKNFEIKFDDVRSVAYSSIVTLNIFNKLLEHVKSTLDDSPEMVTFLSVVISEWLDDQKSTEDMADDIITLQEMADARERGEAVNEEEIVFSDGMMKVYEGWGDTEVFFKFFERLRDFEVNINEDGVVISGISGFPMITGNYTRMPSFRTSYKTTPYLRKLLLDLRSKILNFRYYKYDTDDKVLIDYITMYNELCQTAETVTLTSGTMEGQAGRLSAVYKVHNENRNTIINGKYSGLPQLPTKQAKLLVKFFGGVRYSKNQEFGIDLSNPNFMDREAYPLSKYVMITESSDPGIIWNKANLPYRLENPIKRGDVVVQDFMLADSLMQDCAAVANYVMTDDDFWDKWEFIVLAEFKNKEEKYNISDFYVKTRNYYPFCSFAQLPAQVILKALVSEHIEHFTSNQSSIDLFVVGYNKTISRTLIGWSPFHWGLQSLITSGIKCLRRNMERGVNHFFLTYADNLFVFVYLNGRIHWLSCDGSKMEGCIERETVALFNEYLIDSYEEATRTKVHPMWRVYLLDVFPEMATESIAVWGGEQFPTKSLGSGTQGTAYYNNTKMTICGALSEMRKIDIVSITHEGKLRFSLAFNALCKEVGITMKLEAYTLDIDKWDSKTDLRLDCLGYDGKVMTLGEEIVLVPVLNYDRFKNMILFRRQYVEDEETIYDSRRLLGKVESKTLTPVETKILDVFRHTAAWYNGGWCRRPYDFWLSSLIRRDLKYLIKRRNEYSLEDMGGILETFADSDEAKTLFSDFLEPMTKDLGSIFLGVPTMYKVLSVIFDEEFAMEFVDWNVKQNLANLSIASEDILKQRKNKFANLGVEIDFYDTTHVALETLEEAQELATSLNALTNEGASDMRFQQSARLQVRGNREHQVQDPNVGRLKVLENFLKTAIKKQIKLHVVVTVPKRLRSLSNKQAFDSIHSSKGALTYYSLYIALANYHKVKLADLKKFSNLITKVFVPDFIWYPQDLDNEDDVGWTYTQIVREIDDMDPEQSYNIYNGGYIEGYLPVFKTQEVLRADEVDLVDYTWYESIGVLEPVDDRGNLTDSKYSIQYYLRDFDPELLVMADRITWTRM